MIHGFLKACTVSPVLRVADCAFNTQQTIAAMRRAALDGAQKDCWFSHIAVECPGEETSNEWCEPVTDAEYAALDADCAQNP